MRVADTFSSTFAALGMWWTTYERHWNRYQQYEMKVVSLSLERMKKQRLFPE